jgi:hypothetical protein
VAARRALEEIEMRLPQSHFAKMARLRARQLPESRRELLESRKPRKIPLPALSESLDSPGPLEGPRLTRSEALNLVSELVEKLKQKPDDAALRERIATVYAEALDRSDLGIEQLELLQTMPGQPDPKKAHWLSLAAAWNLRYRSDRPAAQRCLERLIRDFPQTPQAFAAQRRLNLLEMEEAYSRQKNQTSPPVERKVSVSVKSQP